MSDKVELVAKGIAAIALNALVSICLLIYCYERSMGHRWGTVILIVSTTISMSIAVILMSYGMNKRSKQI